MTTGELIREHRKRMGLTQKRLGELSGTSESTIKQYELGKRQPRIEQLKKIANVFNVPIWELLGITKQEALVLNLYPGKVPYDVTEVGPAIAYDIVYQKNLKDLRQAFNLLNFKGQKEAIKRVSELSEISKYKKKPQNQQEDSDIDEE